MDSDTKTDGMMELIGDGLYPTGALLEKLEKFELGKTKLIDYLRLITDHWWSADGLIHFEKGPTFPELPDFGDSYRMRISTGGWSGNEDIIDAVKKSDFCFLFWEEWKRGGHFVFEFSVKDHPELEEIGRTPL